MLHGRVDNEKEVEENKTLLNVPSKNVPKPEE